MWKVKTFFYNVYFLKTNSYFEEQLWMSNLDFIFDTDQAQIKVYFRNKRWQNAYESALLYI